MRYRRFGTNLIHSRRPVQQLLVRVIFLPGISDSGKPICHLTSRSANYFADAERRVRRTESSSTFQLYDHSEP